MTQHSLIMATAVSMSIKTMKATHTTNATNNHTKKINILLSNPGKILKDNVKMHKDSNAE